MKFALFATCAAIVATSSALAADLPARTPTIALAPVAAATWGGFYAGGNFGYAWTDSSFTHLEGGRPTGERFSNNPNGVLGGAQIGARYQVQSLSLIHI